jgi:hypothetical protein
LVRVHRVFVDWRSRMHLSTDCETAPMGHEHGSVRLRGAAIALTGLLVGGSNHVLALALGWSNGIVHDVIMIHFGLFCVLWTAWTVALNVFVVWNMTRCGQSSLSSKSIMHPRQHRTMLRMESIYITGSILGIWSTWIGIDVMHNRTGHIVSSVVLLCASLTILHCWTVKPDVESSPTEDGNGSYVSPPLLLVVQTV